ncbi:MAG: phosphatase PAP2 family protein [Thiobacillus sp.]|nr:phosphatase PAP2 family protein [Thiobacillus sp.]
MVAVSGKTISIFLDSREARARLRFALRVSVLLWAGALASWLTHADTAVFQNVETSRALLLLRPFCEGYSEWGLFIFYLPFMALLVLGMLAKNGPFRILGLAYVFAQLFGTVLLVHLIKLGSGRLRPQADHMQGAFFQVSHFAQAIHSSFPSSHAVDTAVGALFLAVLLRSRSASTLALAATLLMALSRIVVGKHYMSDVLAGLALGAAIVGIVMHVYLLPRWRKSETAPTH